MPAKIPLVITAALFLGVVNIREIEGYLTPSELKTITKFLDVKMLNDSKILLENIKKAYTNEDEKFPDLVDKFTEDIESICAKGAQCQMAKYAIIGVCEVLPSYASTFVYDFQETYDVMMNIINFYFYFVYRANQNNCNAYKPLTSEQIKEIVDKDKIVDKLVDLLNGPYFSVPTLFTTPDQFKEALESFDETKKDYCAKNECDALAAKKKSLCGNLGKEFAKYKNQKKENDIFGTSIAIGNKIQPYLIDLYKAVKEGTCDKKAATTKKPSGG